MACGSFPGASLFAAARNSACDASSSRSPIATIVVERRVDQLFGEIASREIRGADREVARRRRNDVLLEVRGVRVDRAGSPYRRRVASESRSAALGSEANARSRSLPSMSRAPRMRAAPRSANSCGGFVTLALAAASNDGAARAWR